MGTPTNDTFRLLDSKPIREKMDSSNPDVTFLAAIVSQRVFEDVVRAGYTTDLHPDRLEHVIAEVEGIRSAGMDIRAETFTPGKLRTASRRRSNPDPQGCARTGRYDYLRQRRKFHLGWRLLPRREADQGAVVVTMDEGDIGNSISGGNFFASVEQIIYNRDVLIAKELDKGTIEWFCDIHVETTASATARTILNDQLAVALIGSPGCGRRTTGVVLLSSLDVRPRAVVLDLEDLNRPLGVLPRQGYLLDFDEVHDQLTAKTGLWLQDLVARVRDAGSYLVVRARSQSWRTLELDDYTLRTVLLTAPPAITVFQSHLRNMTSPTVASQWVQHGSIIDQLAQADPAEGVRLAQIAQDVIAAGIPDPQQVGEAIAAYKNWTDVLASWFGDTTAADKGYSRALLLATAALDGALRQPSLPPPVDSPPLSSCHGIPAACWWAPMSGRSSATLRRSSRVRTCGLPGPDTLQPCSTMYGASVRICRMSCAPG
jgi:hypothetical protein